MVDRRQWKEQRKRWEMRNGENNTNLGVEVAAAEVYSEKKPSSLINFLNPVELSWRHLGWPAASGSSNDQDERKKDTYLMAVD